ncbi:testican-1 isoform X2 [Stegostoma tigrinum]|uniref:testican-1 isoform X2 n=1 Tax=Stegostoma tigrinum TaxID=3053191 RepID=UPI0028700BB1|nr:testican-1 isoform X2 [Stegostoma tigrinum]
MLASLMGVFIAICFEVESRRPEATHAVNFLDDEKWLTTVSQYDKERRYWNKFRDDDYFRSWNPNKPFDQALDPTKDPCLKVKCSQHKVCVTHDYQTALCVNRKQLMHSVRQKKDRLLHRQWNGGVNLVKCKPCAVTHPSSVCGSNGHTYSSKCKLDYQACSARKKITMKCKGPCPCLPDQESVKLKSEKTVCNEKELRNLASRLKDWFGALHADANQDAKLKSVKQSEQTRFDTSILPICKDSLGWIFNKLDMNYDLLLDQSELGAIYLDKYEQCIKPLFNSCDTFKDGKLSNNEWCYCFQRQGGLPCQAEINKIQRQSRGKHLLGTFIPRCSEDGYYKPIQCHSSSGQCWCADKYGNELAGSRREGTPICEDQENSGDFGSGVFQVLSDDQDDKRETQNEEEEKVSQGGANEDDEDSEDDKDDDIGYIW